MLFAHRVQAARRAGATEARQRILMGKFLDVLRDSMEAGSPPAVADRIQQLVKEETGIADPYPRTPDDRDPRAFRRAFPARSGGLEKHHRK